MIAVEARGRLGNHMFQFAFGLAAAKRLGTDFTMSEDLLRESFTLAPHGGPVGRGRRALEFRLRRRLSPYPVVKIEGDADPADVLTQLSDGRLYAGFFQSERYFENAHAEVAAAFRPLSVHERAFRAAYADLLSQPYVCCHVRATDYRQFAGGVVLPMTYYRDCLDRVGAGTPIVFVGDDLAEAEAEFAGEDVRFERNAEILDLLLLVHARTVVTSNSSFGWWGAWLSASPGKRVLAPRYWIGFRAGRELPRDVIPPGWTQIAVDPGA